MRKPFIPVAATFIWGEAPEGFIASIDRNDQNNALDRTIAVAHGSDRIRTRQ
jgi:hypothetical protein